MKDRNAATLCTSSPTKGTVSRCFLPLAVLFLLGTHGAPGQVAGVANRVGVRMAVDTTNSDPALQVTLPGGVPAQRSFKVLMPEHVTVRRHGQPEAEHLYIYGVGHVRLQPEWQKLGNELRYATTFGPIHFTASATLAEDGILFHYEFTNDSAVDYDMAQAVTDPRFSTFFFDPRLERTYVHHADGFSLLAEETPQRLTLPLGQWLPARYHAQFTAPIPAERTQHRDDGITYYYSSRRVDLPMIATYSVDHSWIAASFARDTGNVWSNPELTCQHVDPEVALPHGAHSVYEVKLLLFQGSLDDALKKAEAQRATLLQTGSQ